jgi:hypothetical protein
LSEGGGFDKDVVTENFGSPLHLARALLTERHEVINYLESIGAKDIDALNVQRQKPKYVPGEEL